MPNPPTAGTRPMIADPSLLPTIAARDEPGVVLTQYVCDCGLHRSNWIYRCSTCGVEPRYVTYACWPLTGHQEQADA